MTNEDAPPQRRLLIVDDDAEFLDFLKASREESEPQKIVAHSGAEAQRLLADPQYQFYGIFINPRVSRPSGLSVIRSALHHRPASPVVLLLDKGQESGLGEQELRNLRVKEIIRKPLPYRELVRLVAPIALSFDAEAALAKARLNPSAELGSDKSANDDLFLPIRAEDFLSGSKSFFDVFVRINSGRYVKLLQAGDGFEPQRLENYLRKGVTYFYIQKALQEEYLKYCDHLASNLAKRTDLSVEIKAAQVLNAGEETVGFLKRQGLSDANIHYATKFVSNVRLIVNDLKAEKETFLKGFLSNLAAYEHGVSTSMIAGILCNSLEIQMERPAAIVGVAALFHDIGLYQLPQELWDEDESKMTKEQIALYRTHPELGGEILSQMKGVHRSTIQAVVQHHVRSGRRGGFPEGIHSAHRSKVGELVGISDEFSKYIVKFQSKVTGSSPELLAALEREVFPGFSRQIIYGFRSAFFSSTSKAH